MVGRAIACVLAIVALSAGATARAQDPAPLRDDTRLSLEGHFLTPDGRFVPFAETYEMWRHSHGPARPVVALGYQVGLLAIGTTWYWAEKDFNIADWDYPSITDRLLLRAFRFDDNRFSTNTLGHPIAGSGYYGMSRVAGLDVWAASALAFLTSAVWEFVLEWREKVSINDTIITPIAGMAIGEWLHQLGDYVNSAPQPTWANTAAAATVGLPRFVDEQTHADRPLPDVGTDALGFSAAWWHRFELGWQAASVTNDASSAGAVHGLRARGELFAMPGFLSPGSFSTTFAEGNRTHAELDTLFDSEGLADLDLRVEADLAGYYQQRIVPVDGSPSGHATMASVSVAFRHSNRDLLGRRDQIALAQLPGPAGHLWLVQGPWLLQMRLDAHLDFAAVRSLVFAEWARENGLEGVKSVLEQRSYYFAVGLSSRFALSVELHGLEVGGNIALGGWSSIEGLDRREEEVFNDADAEDQMVEWEAFVSFVPPDALLHVRLGAAERVRWSIMEDARERRRDSRLTASAGLRF